ncbi:MAG: hypothetical protein ABII27_05150 [bacterium]
MRIKREDFDSTINLIKKTGTVTIAKNSLSFNSYLRVLFSMLLINKKSLLIHSSGLIVNDKAHIFIGKSGSGKTTIIRNSKEFQSLGDELICISNIKGVFCSFSTPFGGELPQIRRNLCFPLKSIYKIIKSGKPTIKKLSKHAAFTLLLKCAMNFSNNEDTISKITKFISKIIKRIPLFELQTTKTLSFKIVCIGEIPII